VSDEERYGARDLSYSAWHRVRSIARYVGLEAAQNLKMVDQDVTLYLELDPACRAPLALIETAQDVGQARKPASATARLAELCGLPAFTVLYKVASTPNPADPAQRDIEAFRVRRIWPAPEHDWRSLTPKEWAKGLLQVRAWSADRMGLAANDDVWEPAPYQGRLFDERQA